MSHPYVQPEVTLNSTYELIQVQIISFPLPTSALCININARMASFELTKMENKKKKKRHPIIWCWFCCYCHSVRVRPSDTPQSHIANNAKRVELINFIFVYFFVGEFDNLIKLKIRLDIRKTSLPMPRAHLIPIHHAWMKKKKIENEGLYPIEWKKNPFIIFPTHQFFSPYKI